MSTCVAPEGKVRHTFQSGKSAPDGWLIDAEGNPTNDPGALYENPRGALLPFGESAGHKGFGLSFLVDVLAGALTAAGCARPDAPHQSPGRGLVFLALDVETFTTTESFQGHVKTLVEHVTSCPPAPGFEEVLVPGEFEYRQRQTRQRDGFEVPDATWQAILELHEGSARLREAGGGQRESRARAQKKHTQFVLWVALTWSADFLSKISRVSRGSSSVWIRPSHSSFSALRPQR